MINLSDSELRTRANNITWIILDVDGVMTDGGIVIDNNGIELKRFHVHDGIAINLAKAVNIGTAIITSRTSVAVEKRSVELKIDEVHQGASNKLDAFHSLVSKYSLNPSEICYIGDDIQDIPIMKLIGLPIAVGNALSIVKESSIHVTKLRGGDGAVRESIEWILELRGQKEVAYKSVVPSL